MTCRLPWLLLAVAAGLGPLTPDFFVAWLAVSLAVAFLVFMVVDAIAGAVFRLDSFSEGGRG